MKDIILIQNFSTNTAYEIHYKLINNPYFSPNNECQWKINYNAPGNVQKRVTLNLYRKHKRKRSHKPTDPLLFTSLWIDVHICKEAVSKEYKKEIKVAI